MSWCSRCLPKAPPLSLGSAVGGGHVLSLRRTGRHWLHAKRAPRREGRSGGTVRVELCGGSLSANVEMTRTLALATALVLILLSVDALPRNGTQSKYRRELVDCIRRPTSEGGFAPLDPEDQFSSGLRETGGSDRVCEAGARS